MISFLALASSTLAILSDDDEQSFEDVWGRAVALDDPNMVAEWLFRHGKVVDFIEGFAEQLEPLPEERRPARWRLLYFRGDPTHSFALDVLSLYSDRDVYYEKAEVELHAREYPDELYVTPGHGNQPTPRRFFVSRPTLPQNPGQRETDRFFRRLVDGPIDIDLVHQEEWRTERESSLELNERKYRIYGEFPSRLGLPLTRNMVLEVRDEEKELPSSNAYGTKLVYFVDGREILCSTCATLVLEDKLEAKSLDYDTLESGVEVCSNCYKEIESEATTAPS